MSTKQAKRLAAIVSVSAAVVLLPMVAVASTPAAGTSPRHRPEAGPVHVSAAVPGGPAAKPAARNRVRVVRPNQRLRLAGRNLWLTADPAGKCVWSDDGGGTGCRKVVDPNTIDGPGILGAQGDGVLTSGIYRGPGKPAYAAVTVENVTVPGTIVTLAGDPGWAVYYAVTPQRPVEGPGPPSAPRVVVYDTAGKALATLDPSGAG